MDKSHPLLKNKIRYFLITTFFIVFTVLVVVFFMTKVRIQKIEIDNCTYSDQKTVLAAANIKLGTHSYAIDKNKISLDIIKKNPYVASVDIKRTGLTTLTVTLTEDKPCFYVKYNGEYFVLSSTLRVLAKYTNPGDFVHLEVYPIEIMPLENATLGKTVVFREEYAVTGKECISMLTKISDSSLYGNITNIDFSNRFDLRVTYKDKYEILFGSPVNFDSKLSLVIGTIEFLENPENNYSAAKGIIRAHVDGETSFEPTGKVQEN